MGTDCDSRASLCTLERASEGVKGRESSYLPAMAMMLTLELPLPPLTGYHCFEASYIPDRRSLSLYPTERV